MDPVSLFFKKNINGIIIMILIFYMVYIHFELNIAYSILFCYIFYFFYLLSITPSYIKPTETSSEIPCTIYTYWHDLNNEKNEVVNRCIQSWKRHNPTYTICILNKESIKEYNLPITDKMTPQFISDFVRLGVLAKHGGIWMDASVYLHASLDWVHTYQVKKSCEFVGYEQSTGEGFPGIESWFFACIPQSQFIQDWKNEFFKSRTYSSTASYITHIKRKINLNHLYDPHYLCIYASAQVLVQKPHSYSLYLLDGNGPLSLMVMCFYPFYPLFYREPLVKYVSWTRQMMEQTGFVHYL